ncbi:MAG: DEAD/DEAH box helicase, partial [Pseudomonadota bacterium]
MEITTQRLLPFNRHVLLLIQNNKLKFSSGDFGLLQTLLGQFDDVADNDFVLEADWELVYTLVSQNKLIVNSLGDTRPIALYKSCTDSDQEDVEFCLSIELNTEADKSWKVWGYLLFKQSNKKVCLWDVTSIHHPNIFLMDHCFYHFTTPLYLPLMKHFHEGGGLMIPLDELPLFIQEVFNKFGQCPISSGESLKIDNEIEAPTPLFYINTKSLAVSGQLWFRYGNKEFPSTIHNDDRNGILAGVLNSRFSSRPDLTAGIASYTLHLSWPDFDREYDHFKAVHRRPGLRFEKANKTFSINSDEALNLIYRLLELGVEVWAENLQVKILENYIFNIMAQENWFEIDMINSYSRNQKIESWQLIHLLKKQSLFLRLDDGTIGVLPEKWMLLLQDLFRYSKDGHFSFAATPHFEDLKTQFADLFTGDEKFQKLAMEFKNIAKLEGVPASSRFKSTLRKYQEQGLAWLIFLDKLNLGGLLADEMGLGKTVQILAFLDHTMAEVVTARPATLIVAPKSLTEYWYRETQRFCPHLRVKILNTFEIQNQTCENLASNDYADIFIISYGLARRNISILRLLTFDYIILDEAQVIKNPAAQTTIAVKQLNSNKKLDLTGTPIENHLGDL